MKLTASIGIGIVNVNCAPRGSAVGVVILVRTRRKCLVFPFWRMAGQYFVSMAQSGLVSASDASAEKIARRPKLMSSFIKNIPKY